MAKYTDAAAVTPHDTNLLAKQADAVVVSVAGNIALTLGNGTEIIVGIAAGIPLEIPVKRVKAASTTATGIVALYEGPHG